MVPQVISDAAWTVSQNKWFRVNIVVWGMPKSLSTLEIRTKLADLGLVGFARGVVAWEGNHVRLVLWWTGIKCKSLRSSKVDSRIPQKVAPISR